MEITKFNSKLNKLDGKIYTVEEEINLIGGIYEATLAHDNVNIKTVNIYTGSQLTGDKIENYFLSTPSETPWKYSIKILAPGINKVYVTYETTGDTVEAEDINNVQDAINNTQKSLNDEIDRATNAENNLNNNINNEINRAKKAESDITNVINTNKPIWDDKYSRSETDNKLSALVTSLDWKEAVATFNDIATTYPTPDDGWTVNVKDTDITYRYGGTAWIPISANSIPLATKDVDGKMSKQDKIDHDDMNSKKHTHANKGILDVITQGLLDMWNSAYNHISDAIKHITSSERTLWNTVSDKLDKSGGTLTGRIIVSAGSNGGIAFPNDSFGGGGDTATITLENPTGGEATEMTFTVTNDATDIANFKLPDINGLKVNRNTVWNAGNFNPSSKSDTGHTHDGFARLYLLSNSVDISDPNKKEFYGTCVTNNASAPTTNWWHILNIPHASGDGYGAQLAIGYFGTNDIYVRTANGTTWGSWGQIYTSGGVGYGTSAPTSFIGEGSQYQVYV